MSRIKSLASSKDIAPLLIGALLGVTGCTGDNGATGAPGPPGEAGEPGEMGSNGNTGEKGDLGANGDPGEAGVQGPPGPMGASGVVNAVAPLTYDAATQAVGIQLPACGQSEALTTDGSALSCLALSPSVARITVAAPSFAPAAGTIPDLKPRCVTSAMVGAEFYAHVPLPEGATPTKFSCFGPDDGDPPRTIDVLVYDGAFQTSAPSPCATIVLASEIGSVVECSDQSAFPSTLMSADDQADQLWYELRYTVPESNFCLTSCVVEYDVP